MEDRDHAISKAIKLAEAKDIILIAGKGHETYQILGRKIHFDDNSQRNSQNVLPVYVS